MENYRAIRRELEQYARELGERPEIVAISKAELPDAAAAQQRLSEAIGCDVLAISAVTGQGLDKLLWRITEELDRQATTRADGTTGHEPIVRTPPHRNPLLATPPQHE
jgi:GTP-binding protein